jgi:hypothetical protein
MAPRYPAIPLANPNDIKSLAASVQAMKEILEILLGQRGADTDAAVTVGSLPGAVTDAGIGTAGAAGADGRMGPPFFGSDGDDGQPGIPGRQGIPGPPGLFMPGRDGDDGDPIIVPGPPGIQGPPGLFMPGRDGDDGDTVIVPGLRGTDGKGGFAFKFNSSRSVVADPTAGFFTYDGGDSTVAISFTDADGNSIPAWILFWATVGTSANRGTLYVFQPGTARFIALRMTGSVTNNVTWASMSCTLLAANDTWGNGDFVSMFFVPDGIQGANGLQGVAGQFMWGFDGEDGERGLPIPNATILHVASMSRAAVQTQNYNGSFLKISLDTKIYDDPGGFTDVTNSRFVVVVDGKYDITGQFYISGQAVGATVDAAIYVNSVGRALCRTVAGVNGDGCAVVTDILSLVRGDTIELYASTSTNGNLTTSTGNFLQPRMSVAQVK